METEATEKKDVVPGEYRDRYKQTGGTCGDFIGTELQRIAKDGVTALASVKAENNIPADTWATLNFGMQRMNLANVLRSLFLNGKPISLLGKQYDVSVMVEEYDGEVTEDAGSVASFAEWANLQVNDRTVKALLKTLFPGEAKPSKEEREAARAAAKAAKDAEKAEKAAKTAADKAAKEAAAAAAKEAKEAEKAAAKEAKDAEKAAKVKAKEEEKAAKEAAKAAAAAAKEAAKAE